MTVTSKHKVAIKKLLRPALIIVLLSWISLAINYLGFERFGRTVFMICWLTIGVLLCFSFYHGMMDLIEKANQTKTKSGKSKK